MLKGVFLFSGRTHEKMLKIETSVVDVVVVAAAVVVAADVVKKNIHGKTHDVSYFCMKMYHIFSISLCLKRLSFTFAR